MMAVVEGLTVLANPTRRHILGALREQPKSVGELAQCQPVSRPAADKSSGAGFLRKTFRVGLLPGTRHAINGSRPAALRASATCPV